MYVYCFQSNIGLILHAVEEYELSLRFLEHALLLNTKYVISIYIKYIYMYPHVENIDDWLDMGYKPQNTLYSLYVLS